MPGDTTTIIIAAFGASFLTWIGNTLFFAYKIGVWKSSIEGQLMSLETTVNQFMENERENHAQALRRIEGLDNEIKNIYKMMPKL